MMSEHIRMRFLMTDKEFHLNIFNIDRIKRFNLFNEQVNLKKILKKTIIFNYIICTGL